MSKPNKLRKAQDDKDDELYHSIFDTLRTIVRESFRLADDMIAEGSKMPDYQMKKRYFEVECGDWIEFKIIANSHENAVKKFLIGKNPKTWSPLARVREDHPKKIRRKWFYISPDEVMKNV